MNIKTKYLHKTISSVLVFFFFWSSIFPSPDILYADDSESWTESVAESVETSAEAPAVSWTQEDIPKEVDTTQSTEDNTDTQDTLTSDTVAIIDLTQEGNISENTSTDQVETKSNIEHAEASEGATGATDTKKLQTPEEHTISEEVLSGTTHTGALDVGDIHTGATQTGALISEASASGSTHSGSIIDTELTDTGATASGATLSGEIIIPKGHQAIENIDGKNIVATFTEDTLVKTADKSEIYEEMIQVADAKEEAEKNTTIARAEESDTAFVFEFWKKDTHLKFSHPVEISLDAPAGFAEGDRVDLSVVHAGNPNPTNDSLTLDAADTCNAGKAGNPVTSTTVKDGKVTFYTCGASTFILNATGNSTGIKLWLKADAGTCTSSWCDVTTWDDQSGKGKSFPYQTAAPNRRGSSVPAKMIYSSPAFNFRPVVRFNGTNWYKLLTNLNPRTVFMVYSHTDPRNWTTPFTTIESASLGIPKGLFHGSNNGNIYSTQWTPVVTRNGNNFINGVTKDLVNTSRPPILQVHTRTLTQNINGNLAYYIGRDRDTNTNERRMMGDIAEIIVYDSVLTTEKQRSIESYLALKYGISLDQTTPQSYVLSNNSVAWDPSVAGIFNKNIAGFGRDDSTTLNTKISQSIENTGDILVTTERTLSNLQTLMWSNNGASTDVWQEIGAGSGTFRLPRAWKIQETWGDVWEVIVRYPESKLPIGGAIAPLLLQNPESDTFPQSTNQVIPAETWNNGYWEFRVNLQHGAYITIAKQNVILPPLDGINLWLKADAGTCTSSWCDVTTWSDQSGKGNSFVAQSLFSSVPAKIAYASSVFNLRRTVQLNGTNWYQLGSAAANLNPRTVFMVYSHTDTRAWTTPMTTANDTNLGIPDGLFHGSDNGNVYHGTWTPNVAKNGTNLVNGALKDLVNTPRPPILQVHTRVLTQNVNGTLNYFIGRDRDASNTGERRMMGDIAEIIVYDSVLTTEKQRSIESYLALKYGISLDQTTPQSYVLSNNSVAWDPSVAGIFNKNIAGFGRDDSTTLNTKISQSIENTGDIIVSSPTMLSTNFRTLMWANNGAGTGSWQTTDIPGGMSRLPRAWQIQEKMGDVGNVTVRYPANMVPTGLSGSLLLIQSTTSPTFPITSSHVVTGNLVNGYWEFSVNLADGDYITFAQGSVSDAVPPQLSVDFLSGAIEPIGNFSKNISYSDTGSQVNTATLSGSIQKWNPAIGKFEYSTGVTFSNISDTGAIVNVSGLPLGRYRLDLAISDNAGNVTPLQTVFYVDRLEWNISADVHDIGDIRANTLKNAPDEFIITVKTIGVPFRVTMQQTQLQRSGFSIPFWNWLFGSGYKKDNILTSAENPVIIAESSKLINERWEQTITTYRVRYWVFVDDEQAAGQYFGNMSFQITADY